MFTSSTLTISDHWMSVPLFCHPWFACTGMTMPVSPTVWSCSKLIEIATRSHPKPTPRHATGNALRMAEAGNVSMYIAHNECCMCSAIRYGHSDYCSQQLPEANCSILQKFWKKQFCSSTTKYFFFDIFHKVPEVALCSYQLTFVSSNIAVVCTAGVSFSLFWRVHFMWHCASKSAKTLLKWVQFVLAANDKSRVGLNFSYGLCAWLGFIVMVELVCKYCKALPPVLVIY